MPLLQLSLHVPRSSEVVYLGPATTDATLLRFPVSDSSPIAGKYCSTTFSIIAFYLMPELADGRS
jgi:hypothetical protein